MWKLRLDRRLCSLVMKIAQAKTGLRTNNCGFNRITFWVSIGHLIIFTVYCKLWVLKLIGRGTDDKVRNECL